MKKQIYYLKLTRPFIFSLMFFLCISITQAQELPDHWENDDVGDVINAGSATFEDDVFTVNGSGADIWGTADGFHFAYQPSKGDCEITANITSIAQTSYDAKACVMIRETLDAGSKFAMSVACPGPDVGTYFQRRPETDASCGHDNLNHEQPAPVWVKLVRVENTFTASYSTDGETWLPEGGISTDIEMAEDALIGLGVCGKAADGTLCEAIFESVEVDPGIEYIGINKLTANKLSVYPNPVSGKLTLNLNNNYSGNSNLTIYNSMSKIVMKETLSGSKHILDLKTLPSGVYLITLTNEQGKISRKIIKN